MGKPATAVRGGGRLSGKMIAAAMAGRRPTVDPRPFRFSRFGEMPRPRPLVGT